MSARAGLFSLALLVLLPWYLTRPSASTAAPAGAWEALARVRDPELDASIVDLVNATLPYITDAIWIGKMNNISRRVDMRGWGPVEMKLLEVVKSVQDDDMVRLLYKAFKDNPKVKWKESMKKVLGIPISQQAGEDR